MGHLHGGYEAGVRATENERMKIGFFGLIFKVNESSVDSCSVDEYAVCGGAYDEH